MEQTMQTVSEPILVKRYARLRLYDTSRSCYVTIADLRRWRSEGLAFVVREADSGDDITRVTLG